MGQYYKACLITELDFRVIEPNWSKLMEHSYYWNLTMKRVEKLLSMWSRRVIWMWDYAECSPLCRTYRSDSNEDRFWADYDKCDKELLLEREEWKNYYLLNYSKGEFINMTRQEMNKDLQDSFWWVVHPLPLLTRATTEFAGWDYHSELNLDKLWRWCWDKIYIMSSEEELEKYLISQQEMKDMTDVLCFKE